MNLLSRIREDRSVLTLVAALVTGLVVTVVVLIAVWHGSHERRSLDNAEADALAAARTYAVDLTSYDYAHLDKDFSWAIDGATPSFAKQYREANKPLRTVIEKLKATAKGNVREAAATAKNDRSVQVLVFIDQTITNTTNKTTRKDRSRVVMYMVKRDGSWLVDDLQLR